MATKNEKIICTLLGAGFGWITSYNNQVKNDDVNKNPDNIWATFKGTLIGALGGYAFASIFGSPNDTVNYTHYYKGKRVYEGITYSDRFKKRMLEHKNNGKLFTRVIKDEPKPRVEALKLERENIIKYKPINNIQFNDNWIFKSNKNG